MRIDHVDGLDLDEPQVEIRGNELRSLAYLHAGLSYLYGQVSRAEDQVRQRLPADKRFSLYGNAPELADINQGLLACAFHWYAVTACNYVRMVGWLAPDSQPSEALAYVKRVIPQVYEWRNKVGAHFALVDPNKEDTAADLAASVMFPIAFDDDAFWTGIFQLTVRQGGQTSTSRQDMRWSLTHTHDELISRYWPGIPASSPPPSDATITLVVAPGEQK